MRKLMKYLREVFMPITTAREADMYEFNVVKPKRKITIKVRIVKVTKKNGFVN